MIDFDKKPDFINEIGVKWWLDDSITKYAQREDMHGTTLDAACYAIEEPNGRRTRVLVCNGEIIEEDQLLEGMAIKIDLRKFLKRS